jgi:hypothetical protein
LVHPLTVLEATVGTFARTWLLPDSIQFHLLESEEAFDAFALRDKWTPFEAACLIKGMLPGQIVNGSARVGVVPEHRITQELIDKFESVQPDLSHELIGLASTIRSNVHANTADATEITTWALKKNLLSPQSPLVRQVLGVPPKLATVDDLQVLRAENERLQKELGNAGDSRGQHHQEKRLAILGAVIRELAQSIPDWEKEIPGLLRGGNVNASALAKHLASMRDAIGMPEESVAGFAHRNVEDAIREALKATKELFTDKK